MVLHVVSRRSRRPSAIIAALSAPEDEPATRRTRWPRRTTALATPASHAPLAPPPDRISPTPAPAVRGGWHAPAAGDTLATIDSAAIVRVSQERWRRVITGGTLSMITQTFRGDRATVLASVGNAWGGARHPP